MSETRQSEPIQAAIDFVGTLRASHDRLLSVARRWDALDAGSWHPDRYASEKAELLAETRAAISRATEE